MKKTISMLSVMALLLSCLLCLGACGKEETTEANLWDTAKYASDTQLGEGATKLTVQVKAEDKLVTFTIHTDKPTVGEAMQEYGLLEGEDSEYGLFVKRVNGILADYDVDQYYWAFYVNDEYAMTGVDATTIEEGVTYRFERSK